MGLETDEDKGDTMRNNWWDYEDDDFGERICIMDDRDALLRLYGSGFVVCCMSFDNDDEKEIAIDMCRKYVKDRKLTEDDVKIVLRNNMAMVKIK